LENAELTETQQRAFAAMLIFIVSAGTATPYTFTEFPIPMVADIMVAGSDGAVWFASHDRNQNTIGRITIDGAVTEFPIPVPVGAARAAVFHNLAVGPDGALWFGVVRDILPPVRLSMGYMSVGRITSAGAISEFPLPSASKFLSGITAGPDGALWFTEVNDKKLGRMTTAGKFTELPVPSSTGPLITLALMARCGTSTVTRDELSGLPPRGRSLNSPNRWLKT